MNGDDKPRNARVVGRSECDDLAVIDIAGDGYPFFVWSTAGVAPGDPVHAAGFAAGDTSFALTDGTVSSVSSLATTWSATDDVIKHDAETQPGESGGPLFEDDGKVVGVNYAANASNDDRFAGRGDLRRGDHGSAAVRRRRLGRHQRTRGARVGPEPRGRPGWRRSRPRRRPSGRTSCLAT